MDSKRIVYLDALRITAIFAMMLLHVSTSNSILHTLPPMSFDWQICNAYDAMTRFCVPVLIMISGVFFLHPSKEITLKHLLKHNILRIVTAFIFWSLAYAGCLLLYHLFVEHRPLGQEIKNFFYSFINGHYHMWFMFLIVGLYLIVPLLRAIAANKKLLKYFIILSFLFCYLNNLLQLIPVIGNVVASISNNKMNMSFVSGYTGYFCLGYYLHNYNMEKSSQKKIYILAFISIIMTITISSLWSIKTGAYWGNLYGNLLPNTFFVSMAFFIFFKYNVTNIKFKENTISKISHLSLLTFGMYLVHDFFNIIFVKIGFTNTLFNPILSVPIITIIVFIGSFFTTFIISKVPILNKYVI